MNQIFAAVIAIGATATVAMAQENRIDLIRPDAPELAAYGPHAIGVRTVEVVNKDQVDIAKVEPGKDLPRYDRKLTVEVWYPAESAAAATPGIYEGVYLRDGETQVTLTGRAVREAPPLEAEDEDPFPLAIISHGYPGNRFLLSPLAENLASKGYVVAAIDHTDSTYNDQAAFGSTVVNRPLDQKFVLDEIERMATESDSFLEGLVDPRNAAIVG